MTQQELKKFKSSKSKEIDSRIFSCAIILDELYGKRLLDFNDTQVEFQKYLIKVKRNETYQPEKNVSFLSRFFVGVFGAKVHETSGYVLQPTEFNGKSGIVTHKYSINGFIVDVKPSILFYEIPKTEFTKFLLKSPEEYRNLLKI